MTAMRRVFVTGSAGFIGYHLCALLLREGFVVHGYDGMTEYYDLRLKRRRQQMLLQNGNFAMTEGMLEDEALLSRTVDAFQPDVMVHLAAQAGVRYSIEAPGAYVSSNIVGSFNLMEAARRVRPRHLMMASTSSVYGANEKMPFAETDKADLPLTIYAATKKANEAMAHSNAHLWGLPTTLFRFFTVYGPWGRPDMAYFKFVEAILAGKPIDIYNHGDMKRDFTYVTDLVRAIRLLIDVPPPPVEGRSEAVEGDSLSPVAPHRIVNIGNSAPAGLLDFIAAIEHALGRKAERNLMPMQPGDVAATWADASLLQRLTGYCPRTTIQEGVANFVEWYLDYKGIGAMAGEGRV